VRELLALPFVPSLRLPDGRSAELAVRTPNPPPATPTTAGPDVCRHLGRLWLTARRALQNVDDVRAHSLAKGHGQLGVAALDFWAACAEHSVEPAEWVAWSLEWWSREKGGQPPIKLVLSGDQVQKGRVRRMYRIRQRHLGGRVTYDPVGRAFLYRFRAMERKLDALVARTAGAAGDDQVRSVVSEFFPRGAEHAAALLAEVHSRCVTAMSGLRDDAARGTFIWVDGAQ
jgi:hypothetical protein